MPDDELIDDATETDAQDGSDESATAEVDPAAKLESDLAAQRKVNRDLERKWKASLRELDELKKSQPATPEGDQPDPDALKAEGRKEALAQANARILRAEIKAAAGGKLNDPNDAIRLLDLDEFEVGDDGEVDGSAIADAIADLIKSKPYLAVQDGKRFQGGGDGGPRNGLKKSLDEQIADAQKSGNVLLALHLQNQKLTAGQ